MYLYNSDQIHYDLLVAEDHRLALLGPVATEETNADTWGEEPNVSENVFINTPDSYGWEYVKGKKNRSIYSIIKHFK